MAQPPTTADGGSSTDPRPALEDAAIVIHPDGYDLIKTGDTDPTESEAVQRQIDALPDEPGGAAFNAAAHPDHSSVEMVDAAYPFDVATTLRLAHVESGRFDVLGDDRLVRCVNPGRESLTWFYEPAGNDVDEAVVQYHEIDDFEKTPIERSKALASIASAKVDVSLVDREVLEECRERGAAMTDGGVAESDESDDQEPNDDWSGRNETWGHDFLVKIEAEGRERVGEIGLLVADKAAVNHVQNTSGYVPSPGRPSKGHLSDTTATFETEHASLTATLYLDTHDEDDAEELFSVIEATLDDASRLDQLTLTVDEDWSRVTEDDDA